MIGLDFYSPWNIGDGSGPFYDEDDENIGNQRRRLVVSQFRAIYIE
jgi:hypothetical protein